MARCADDPDSQRRRQQRERDSLRKPGGGGPAGVDPELESGLLGAATRLHTPAAKRFVLALIQNMKLKYPEFESLHTWLKQWGRMSKNELDAISNDFHKAKDAEEEAALGHEGDGLTLTVTLNTKQMAFERKDRKETNFSATVKNTGKWALRFNEEESIKVFWRCPAKQEDSRRLGRSGY